MEGMRIERLALLALIVTVETVTVFARASVQAPTAGPTFDVVSIKRNTAETGGRPPLGSSINQRPDGGITMTNIPVGTLISRAYSTFASPIDLVGLPSWAMSERYNVSATSSLSQATLEDRAAMLRAMLADRFKLVAHVEKREQQVFDLVVARGDGRLGSGIKPVDIDCARINAERIAQAAAGSPPSPPQFPDFKSPPPPCMLRTVGAPMRDRMGDGQGRLGDLVEGETTMDSLAMALRMSTGRVVVDKTGLSGSYRITMNCDCTSARRPPEIAPPPDAPPSVFTALQEQLGLKLESSRALLDALVIDHLERPTEN
jgi:uncharacterized protein (TIGR03435 family)